MNVRAAVIAASLDMHDSAARKSQFNKQASVGTNSSKDAVYQFLDVYAGKQHRPRISPEIGTDVSLMSVPDHTAESSAIETVLTRVLRLGGKTGDLEAYRRDSQINKTGK